MAEFPFPFQTGCIFDRNWHIIYDIFTHIQHASHHPGIINLYEKIILCLRQDQLWVDTIVQANPCIEIPYIHAWSP